MRQWLILLDKVKTHGEVREDRTGTGTISLFGEKLAFRNISEQFPAVTTKQLAYKQVLGELSCFLRGRDNLKDFHEVGCTIWDANANALYWKDKARNEGDLGRIYGVQWRDWGGGTGAAPVDQLQELAQSIKANPYSRRHVVTAWAPQDLSNICLPPCHILFQAYVSMKGDLDLCVYMRSVDLFLGLPFDIASYATLQILLANETNLRARNLTFMFGDAHIYLDHVEAVDTVLQRTPGALPELQLCKHASLLEFMPDQVVLYGYVHQGPVKARMSV